jgi:hypothetical protein
MMDYVASKESFCREKRVSVKQNGRFRSLVKPGLWDERFEDKKAPPGSSDAQLVGILNSRNDINLQRSLESSISDSQTETRSDRSRVKRYKATILRNGPVEFVLLDSTEQTNYAIVLSRCVRDAACQQQPTVDRRTGCLVPARIHKDSTFASSKPSHQASHNLASAFLLTSFTWSYYYTLGCCNGVGARRHGHVLPPSLVARESPYGSSSTPVRRLLSCSHLHRLRFTQVQW